MVINHKLVHQNRSINLTRKGSRKSYPWQCKELMENRWIKFVKRIQKPRYKNNEEKEQNHDRI